MRIPSGTTNRYIYFVAVDSTDLKSRETGLSSFTVYYEINNGTATAMTTPTVTEADTTNMPGVYSLLIDESGMTTLTSGHDTAELCLHITQASMAPVTRVIEIYRAKMTEGEVATVANGAIDADIERLQGSAIATPSVAGVLEVDLTHVAGSAVSTSSAQLGVNVVNAAGTAWGSGAITAGVIAADAIGASELAADAVAEIADAVWDEALAGHVAAGSTGEALSDAGSAGDPWNTALPGAYGAGTAGKIIGDNINATVSSRASQTSVDTIDDFLDTEVAAILADTNELQTDWANGGRLDLILDARASQTSVDDLPTNAELATALGTADDATLAAIAALNNLSSAQAQTAAAAALTAYDPPTRTEATSDKDEIMTQVNANETKIDTLQTSVNDVPTNAELTTALAGADDAVLAAIAALNNLSNAQLVAAIAAGDDATLAAIAALNNLSEANIRTALGVATANLDTQLDALPTAAENAAALMDLANGVETGLTPRQALRLMAAAMAGELSGAATTTIVIRSAVADDKDRITATVDADGNRSAITVDLT